MKRILLFRHSHAQPPKDVPDREHQLTELGVKHARRVITSVLNRGFVPNLGLVSPYRRARQTMVLLQEACRESGRPDFEVKEWSGCCADGDPKAAMEYLMGIDSLETIAIIGHEPFVSGFVLQATLKKIEFLPCDMAVIGWNGVRWSFEQELSASDLLD